MFQVLVQHYFDHLKLNVEKSDSESDSLKQDDVLYHEAFTIVKVSYIYFLWLILFDLFKGLFKCFNIVSTNSLYTLLSISNPSMQPYD